MIQRLWVQGQFPSTNNALAGARADARANRPGHASRRARWRETPGGYTEAARWVRLVTKVAARRARLEPVPAALRVVIWFWMLGHYRFDSSAWYLPAKWIEDGLVDAGVLPSDRKNVYATGGRCLQTPEEGHHRFEWWDGKPGVVVELRPEGPS